MVLITIEFTGSNGSLALPGSNAGTNVKADSSKDSTVSPTTANLEENLPVLGSYEKLKELLEKINMQNIRHGGPIRYMKKGLALEKSTVQAPMGMADQKSEATTNGSSPDFSTTNVQVQEVDEADIIKTDGKYIYQVNNRRVVVIEAYPAYKMSIAGTIDFQDENFNPMELYLDEKNLVVIGSSVKNIPLVEPKKAPTSGESNTQGNVTGTVQKSFAPEIYPPRYSYGTVKALIYDIRDKKNIQKIRELELEGFYVSSRKIGASLYIVANRNVDYYILKNPREGQDLTPSYRDTVSGDEFINIGYDRIRYFPECPEPNYLIITGLNLDKPGEKANISTYLGAGENIYASTENLYVALTGYEETSDAKHDVNYKDGAVSNEKFSIIPPTYDTNTLIYKFGLNAGKITFKAKGKVPGTILNQFSMDEHKDNFRIATTSGDMWRTDEHTSKNNLYILDSTLKLTGRLEGIAPGEKIYSVRFMGDRAYMVTFKKVDPLFVIDLKDSSKPYILGALKIPGYSDYIHPYDENHIIGFGKDTIEVEQKDAQSNPVGIMAFYQRMKIALFDVTDVNHPKEKFKEIIGDRGTDSELLRNHRALLFSKERNIMAFPITVMEIKNKGGTIKGNFPQYGEFSFQGAYVYSINLQMGFKLKGRITHLSSEDYLKSGGSWYQSEKNIERIIYIGDNLYTLSKGMIKANRMSDLKEIKAVEIPQ
ncbi:hypothetical protein DXT63_14005 [Thermoanaerobacteraceae bacterium SP2]|nr:hypothetical protein DXT63_14005 [Thermoanaerobacteraceae bacterium SP2]